MLPYPNVVSWRKGMLCSESDERAIRGAQVANSKMIGVGIATDGGMSAAHKRIIREDDIADFSSQDGFNTRQIIAITCHFFHCLDREPRVARRWRRAEDACSVPALRCQVPLRFIHDFKP